MQYEDKIKTYERVKNSTDISIEKRNEKLKEIVLGVALFFIAVLVSRVIMINKSSPFGIALLLAVLFLEDNRLSIITGLGVEIGYIINISTVPNVLMYIAVVPISVFLSMIIRDHIKKRVKQFLLIGVAASVIFIYQIFVAKNSGVIALGNTALESMCIIPVYILIDYGIRNFNRIKTRHLFKSEEIVSMSVILALIIAGTWNAEIFGVSVLNILSLLSIIMIGYICGTSIGATTGVAMGVIVGMSNNTIFTCATILGLSGLVAGIFREGGKLLSSIAAMVVFCIMKVYMKNYGIVEETQFLLIEGVMASIIFVAIPGKIYDRLALELDVAQREKSYEEGYTERVRNIFKERLDKLSEILGSISSTLTDLVDNEKLDMTTKSSALVENLANRVCNNCDACKICWGREMMTTYSAFEELLRRAQNNNLQFPKQLERKCMKKGSLIRNTEDIVKMYELNELWKSRLKEGRELMANQFENMSKSLDDVMGELSENFNEDRDVEKRILSMVEKYGMDVEDVFAVRDKSNHLLVQASCMPCSGKNYCVKSILPIINECVESNMRICKDGCKISPDNKRCTAHFEEIPKFEILTSVSRECKDGQTTYGDSFTFGETGNGCYNMALSDGMGSGPQAGRESKAVVDLIDKFTDAGFSNSVAINTINSIMSLKFSEDEKFSTVDLSSIDLYTGDTSFIKVGAVSSFIKRGNNIDIIKSKTLPIGVLDEADIEVSERTVKNGDLIVMVSDGITDCNEKLGGRIDWLLDCIVRYGDSSVDSISKNIIDEAKAISNGKVNDDMTVMVSRVRSLK